MNSITIHISRLEEFDADTIFEKVNSEISSFGKAEKIEAPIDSFLAADSSVEIIIHLLDTQAAAQLVNSIFTLFTTYLISNKIKSVKLDGKNIEELDNPDDRKKIEDKLKR